MARMFHRAKVHSESPDDSTIDEVSAKALQYPSALIADSLDSVQIVDAAIRPVSRVTSFCGPAFTVEEYPGLNGTIHRAAARLESGWVLVINGHGYDQRAIWGALLNLAAAKRGSVAVVVDGAVRDSGELRDSPFPVFARAITPAGPRDGARGAINQITNIGGAIVHPGDFVRGDQDGVVVIPRGDIVTVLERCETLKKDEEVAVEFINDNQMTPRARELGE